VVQFSPRPTYILAPCKPVSSSNNYGVQPCSEVWFCRRGPAQSKYQIATTTAPPTQKPKSAKQNNTINKLPKKKNQLLHGCVREFGAALTLFGAALSRFYLRAPNAKN